MKSYWNRGEINPFCLGGYYKYEWNNCFWFSGGSDGATSLLCWYRNIPLKEHQDGPATGFMHPGSGSSAQRRGFVFGIRVFSLSKSHGLSSVSPLSDKRRWVDLPPSAASFWPICLGQSWDRVYWSVIFGVYRVYWWLYHVVSPSFGDKIHFQSVRSYNIYQFFLVGGFLLSIILFFLPGRLGMTPNESRQCLWCLKPSMSYALICVTPCVGFLEEACWP